MDMQAWGLEWSDKLSFGLSEIDQQHKHFIELINDLNQAVVDRMELAEVRGRLQRLYDYALQEFSSEDELLRQLDYPDAESHAEEHQSIVNDFDRSIMALGETAPMYPWIEAGLKLKVQLINHFLNEDMKFRDYCRSRSR